MAKKQVPAEKAKTKDTPQKQKTSNNNSPINKIIKKKNKKPVDDASTEEPQPLTVSSPSTEPGVGDSGGSSDAEVDEANEMNVPIAELKEDVKKSKSIKKKGESESTKSKGKKKSKVLEDEEEDAEEKSEGALYRFPMNRISRIIKAENPNFRVSQEAVFVINRASEKFLEMFCKEAYARAFLDQKNHVAYKHLSSVVSKRKRFEFLSDFVPEKLKAKHALAQITEAEKLKAEDALAQITEAEK